VPCPPFWRWQVQVSMAVFISVHFLPISLRSLDDGDILLYHLVIEIVSREAWAPRSPCLTKSLPLCQLQGSIGPIHPAMTNLGCMEMIQMSVYYHMDQFVFFLFLRWAARGVPRQKPSLEVRKEIHLRNPDLVQTSSQQTHQGSNFQRSGATG
jgi:hypothetical protein